MTNFIRSLFDKLQAIRILLIISFLVTALIVAFAIKANLSNEKALETAMQDQVRFASWVYNTQVTLELNTSISRTFNPLLNSINQGQNGKHSLGFDTDAFNKSDTEQNNECNFNYLKPIQNAFLFDNNEDHYTSVTADTGLDSPSFEKWIRNAFKSFPQTTDGLHKQLYSDESGIEYLVVMYHMPGSPDSDYDILIGVKSELKNFNRLFKQIWENEELLPGVLSSDQKNEDLMAIRITTPGGNVLFSSGEPSEEPISINGMIGESFTFLNGDLAMIRENVPNVLISGFAGQSNLILFILFVLAAGVSVIAFVQFKKESQLTRLRSDFVSNVSHELRTPVTQIRMFSETLLNGRIHSRHEEEQALQIIEKESRRLTLMISNILDISKKEKKVFSSSPDFIRLDTEIRDTVKAFKPLADSASNQIFLIIEPLTAYMDPIGFRQILINILDNAVKYGPNEQTIQIRLYKVEDKITLSVIDEGPGIPEQFQPKIWEPYWRNIEHTKGNVTGSGIGLAVVREYLNQMNGTAKVKNLPFKGTEILFEFPSNKNSREL
jgi:signal transduction histidine kinase